MPRATTCRMQVSVEEAIRLRDEAVKIGRLLPALFCEECGRRVRPHKEGLGGAHFEHLERNPACSLSDPQR